MFMSYPELEVLNGYVSRIFRVEDVTLGDSQKMIARYRGRLLNEDSVAAYDQLTELVKPYGITPLFRKEDGGQVVYLIPTPVIPKPRARFYVNVILFILTVISMLLMGVDIPPESIPANGSVPLSLLFLNILSGWPFALSMMGILFAHEMGHYVACRIYGVPATPPFFIPAPFLSPLGTLGAFIAMRGIPKNKRVLFDVGVAGPIAGLVVAIPVLFLGLSLSHLGTINHPPSGMSNFIEGNSLFYLFAKYVTFGKFLPEPVNFGGLSPVVYWIRYFLSGQPIPYGGVDVVIHNVALAGWAGLLVTALNLVPVGTLDGGHVAYGLFGDKAKKIFPIAIGVLVALMVLPGLLIPSGSFNFSWLLWVLILFWLGNVRTQPLDDITELDPTRRAVGYTMLVAFILLFTPIIMVAY